MANPTDTPVQTEVEKQTIRDVIVDRIEQERLDRIRLQRQVQREARDERATKRKRARLDRITAQKHTRVAALAGAQTKVQAHVGDASRALRRAISAVREVPLPRHSPEGREQLRVVRNLSSALGALRAVGRSAYSTSDGVDLDFDDFDVGAVD